MNIYPTNVTYEGDIRQYDRGKKKPFHNHRSDLYYGIQSCGKGLDKEEVQ